jgi:hypothetical protein
VAGSSAAITRCEDKHGHNAARFAPFLQNGHAVHFRQAEIEHDCVIGLGVAEEMPLLAVGGRIDHVAGLAQGFLELTLQIGIVFNQEYAHLISD